MGQAGAGGTASPRTRALAKRIATAAILGPLLVGAILWPQALPLTAILTVFLAAAAWEWSALAGVHATTTRLLYALTTTVLGLVALQHVTNADARWALAALAVAGWSGATLQLVRVERGGALPTWPTPANLLLGWLVLLPFWLCVLWLKMLDFRLLLALAALVWLADSLAYFGGMRWGRRRLAPRISPGKTWEGVATAAFAAPLVAIVLAFELGAGSVHMVAALSALGIATIASSIVGDLFESLLKRRAGVKDSGTLLPGHGGVMDRIDSLTAAAPLFYLGVTLLVPNS